MPNFAMWWLVALASLSPFDSGAYARMTTTAAKAPMTSQPLATAPYSRGTVDMRSDRSGGQHEVRPYDARADPGSVHTLHVVWSNHFDAGFDTESWFNQPPQGTSPLAFRVVQKYFDQWIPEAMEMAAAGRASGTPFKWMTQEWILSLLFDCPDAGLHPWSPSGLDPVPSSAPPLLQCPNASFVADVKAVVARGDIFFHAFPHNPSYGFYDVGSVEAGLNLVKATADSLKVPHPVSLSLRDVPGLTRALLPTLTAAEVRFVSVGSGGPKQGHPDVPDLFVWRDLASNASVLVTHDDGYGGGTHVAPNGHALYCAWNRDNSGPINPTSPLLAKLKQEYPHASIVASTLDEYYAAVEPVIGELPVVTAEIGDTWGYGSASDPLKLQLFREFQRRRTACIAAGRCNASAPDFRRFDRLLHKLGEHTGGTDVACYFGDFANWTNAQLDAALRYRDSSGHRLPNYQVTMDSWLEQRSYLPNAIAMLKTGHNAFAAELSDAMDALRKPEVPSPTATPDWVLVPKEDMLNPVTCSNGGSEITFSFDPTAAVKTVESGGTRLFSGAMGSFLYQTVDAEDFAIFGRKYGDNFTACDVPAVAQDTCQQRVMYCGGGASSFVKVNVSGAHPVRRQQSGQLARLWKKATGCGFLTEATLPTEAHVMAGAPSSVWTQWGFDPAARTLDFNLTYVNKTATRLPEALWLRVDPSASAPASLSTRKFGRSINALDVVNRGAVNFFPADAVQFGAGGGVKVEVESLDAGVVGIGAPWPFPTRESEQPEGAPNFGFNLVNNIWSTNFVQWYPFVGEPGEWVDGATALFRFTARFSQS